MDKAGLFMDSVLCLSCFLSPSLSLLPFLPLSLSSGPGPPLQSQRTQDTSQQDLAPEPEAATGLEVFTQKSLAASPEVIVITSPPNQNPNGLKKTLPLGRMGWSRPCRAQGGVDMVSHVTNEHPLSRDS